MSLPPAIPGFWRDYLGLFAMAVDKPWGVVVADPRFPHVHDVNGAAVLAPEVPVSVERIRDALRPMLRRSGADHEQIEVWDATRATRLVVEMGAGVAFDEVMVLRAASPAPSRAPAPEFRIDPLPRLDDAFWAACARLRAEPGWEQALPELLLADREVLVPAGMRLLAAWAGDELAAVATVHQLAGTAYIDNVKTAPWARRRGLASSLVRVACSIAEAGSASLTFLLAVEGGWPADLYRRLGFATEGLVATVNRRLE